MKQNKTIFIVLGVLLVLTGAIVLKTVKKPKVEEPVLVEEEELFEEIKEADESITVEVVESAERDNAVMIMVSGLDGNYEEIEYELTYESEEIIQGVNSGSKPIDVSGEDEFEREVYLGTCSRNVCRPHPGVTSVTIVMEFTDTAGEKSQFTGDFDL